MENLWNKEAIYKAVFYATHAHNRAVPIYDPNKKSFTAHFTLVALNALNFSMNEDIDREFLMTVAILHDTIEDTDVTYEDLKNEFSTKVADAVKALSRNENVEYYHQIPDCIERIKNQPKEVAIVKMADRLFNIRERYSKWTKEKQDKYKIEAQHICDELGYACGNLRLELQKAIDKY
ncbi:MAG: bifunctional (p)ppGpp synthetase/guanosine-3',5'-bis(diphosphate) 3'-pyrophosphohydrolase [Clostridia bacterium]|nr:bifunctional (p)ppGpp synthetase/guanosine-3',5'-bis(diphosphate) 3'-pyrophosphohydrolase [Clostridia bacterium]